MVLTFTLNCRTLHTHTGVSKASHPVVSDMMEVDSNQVLDGSNYYCSRMLDMNRLHGCCLLQI